MFEWCLKGLLRLSGWWNSHQVSSEGELLIIERGHELGRCAPPTLGCGAALIVRFPDDPAPSVSGKRAKVPRESCCISQGAETPHRLLLADPDMRSLGVEKVIHVDPCPTFEYPRTLSANVKKRGRVSIASRAPTVLGCGQPI